MKLTIRMGSGDTHEMTDATKINDFLVSIHKGMDRHIYFHPDGGKDITLVGRHVESWELES